MTPRRTVVSVATDSWVTGLRRLRAELQELGQVGLFWENRFPDGCPPHRDRGMLAGPKSKTVPYAFKAYAMKAAADKGAQQIIWADACIRPIAPLDRIWEHLEKHGVWICRNGWMNHEWTADSAYPDLFPLMYDIATDPSIALTAARRLNRDIPHVVATTFGVDMRHPIGRAFLDRYYQLASTTRAFCGPWRNLAAPAMEGVATDHTCGHCGPATTLGHRHDQTCASVIAWELGVTLCNPPDMFAYAGSQTDKTILIADGAY